MVARFKWDPAPEAKTYLAQWRETKFKTQQELADRIGLAAATISRIETGEREWGKGYLEALAHAVECRVADLFNPPPINEVDRLRSALLAFGVHRDDLKKAVKLIEGFVEDDGAQPEPDLHRDPPEYANPRHAKAPSQ